MNDRETAIAYLVDIGYDGPWGEQVAMTGAIAMLVERFADVREEARMAMVYMLTCFTEDGCQHHGIWASAELAQAEARRLGMQHRDDGPIEWERSAEEWLVGVALGWGRTWCIREERVLAEPRDG